MRCGAFAAGTLVLDNGTLRAEVMPSCGGRLMRFGRTGGANALWRDPDATTNIVDAAGRPRWVNIGGEKTWVGAMSLWKGIKDKSAVSFWPPPAWFDSAPLEVVRADATNILLRSADHASGDWTVSLEREFTLCDDRLILRETLGSCQKMTSAVIDDPRRVWSVTQIPLVSKVVGRLWGEGRMVLDRKGKPCFPEPRSLGGGWIELDMSAAWRDARLDFDGDALAAPLTDGSGEWLVIEQTAPARCLGAFGAPSRAMVFTTGQDAPKPYIELEFVALGPDAEQTLTLRIVKDAPQLPNSLTPQPFSHDNQN